MIGAATIIVPPISDQHLHLLDVVGLAGDQRRRTEVLHLAGRERPDAVEESRRGRRGRTPSRCVPPKQTATTVQTICTSDDREHQPAGRTM